ncbi:hypothetical protein B0J12DRAFT_583264 [Macrophomina phaseolina]|uniref:Essential protein Yae1 N-terminal domain-containing protein n=1 Tax=Macrophomina phaseolina TaxID=35725 RepID=A0ABQ8FYR7_9PEZI|nr:hypothetical protein B0J12DRAFT_583264 [Macrophomina phaseolina]
MPSPNPAPETDTDPFDALLSLEDQYYAEGHALGVADGTRAGLIEGRVFGLEKGFEKFLAMGQLHARSAVWAARLPASSLPPVPPHQQQEQQPASPLQPSNALPQLSTNPRLAKHISTLHALTEPASLSTQNDEDAVSEFDDRWKRAQAKAKMVEKMVGEGLDVGELAGEEKDHAAASDSSAGKRASDGAAKGPKRMGGGGVKMVRKEGRGEERNMEDFGAVGGRKP